MFIPFVMKLQEFVKSDLRNEFNWLSDNVSFSSIIIAAWREFESLLEVELEVVDSVLTGFLWISPSNSNSANGSIFQTAYLASLHISPIVVLNFLNIGSIL